MQAIVAKSGCSTSKLICTVFANQWAANGDEQDEENCLGNSQDKESIFVLNCLLLV